ncbi:hypothetical protein HBH53_021100 [Parastagonospora nodorum]|nr:hypothetical protein HBH53_021100 [Parastagonospora nodorum]KAH4017834.1 hypothetical protein HBI09_194880 [Parastagonospora nodorum]KAH4051226.1 hypothetical protein HBH49_114670 [Parastagonospora nodorum]KAH4806523.1 hypothetical protein HBH61_144230 [Parastagonospora nodorum]KAH4863328.1 hypothetical protein HBH75_006430 [Parastagonospora nodorum]
MITGRKYSVPDPSHQPSQSDTCRWTGMLVNPLCSSKHSPDIVTDGGDQVWFLLYPLSSVPNKHLFNRRGID